MMHPYVNRTAYPNNYSMQPPPPPSQYSFEQPFQANYYQNYPNQSYPNQNYPNQNYQQQGQQYYQPYQQQGQYKPL
jgi:hypothetical protein